MEAHFRWFAQAEAEGRFSFTYANTEEELLNKLTEDIDIVYIRDTNQSSYGRV